MTRTPFLVLALALAPATGLTAQTYYRAVPPTPAQQHRAPVVVVVPDIPVLSELLDAARPSQEAGDSLYNRARRELNNGNFRRAAELFEEFIDNAPARSQYRPECVLLAGLVALQDEWHRRARGSQGSARESARALPAEAARPGR